MLFDVGLEASKEEQYKKQLSYDSVPLSVFLSGQKYSAFVILVELLLPLC